MANCKLALAVWAQRLSRYAGLDFHVLQTLALRTWSIAAGGITLVLLPLWLTSTQQGYYYTFASLLAMQVLFEMGMGHTIVPLVSHEAAHLRFRPDGSIEGHAKHVLRLGDIARLIRRWYIGSAALFAIVMGSAGGGFLARHDQGLDANTWLPVWSVAAVLTAINLYLGSQLTLMEGIGQIGQVARLRLRQSMLGNVALWSLLSLGGGLWAMVAPPLITLLTTLHWSRVHGLRLKPQELNNASSIHWRRDILPLQWRLGASWGCSGLVTNLFVPAVFSTQGAIVAGKLGMALTIFGALSTLGSTWINAKLPALGMYVSRGESIQLNQQFDAAALRSMVFTSLLAFAVPFVAVLASHLGLPAIQRIASPWSLLWLACATVFNTALYICASYMRMHAREPLLPALALSALLSVVAIWWFRHDVTQMMAAHATIVLCIPLPWAIVTLRCYRSTKPWA